MNRLSVALLKGIGLACLLILIMVVISTLMRGWENVNRTDYWVEKGVMLVAFASIFAWKVLKEQRRPEMTGD